MSLEKQNEAPSRSVETLDKKEHKEKRKIRELIPYLKDDPNKVLAKEYGNDYWKDSWEAVKGIGYEKNPGFTRKGHLGEAQRVEYLGNRLEATIYLPKEVNVLKKDEMLKINISNFENQDLKNGEKETPLNITSSIKMSEENIGKLLEDLNIPYQKKKGLTDEICIQIVEKMVNSRKQDYHGISNKEQQEKIYQKQQELADLELFFAIISMDDEGGGRSRIELLQNYIKQEVNSEKMSFKHELQLCSALVILGRSMSPQEILNKFDTENKSGDKVGNVSEWSKDEDILEYVANNPGYFVQNSQEIIDEAKKHIVPYNDEFTNILLS